MTSDGVVSCCVAAHNSERFLAEALDSILAQTYRPLEVIVVDDGSTDRTATIAEAYGERVRVVRQAEAGPPATRNRAIELARGEFVAMLDADDVWHPEKLARQVECLRAAPAAGYCVTHAQVFWSDELKVEAARFRGHRRARPVPAYGASALLVRRTVFWQVGPLREEMTFGDLPEWFVRADGLGIGKVVLPETLLFRRMHAGNLTRRRSAEGRKSVVAFVRNVLDRRRASGGGRDHRPA